MPFYSEHRLLDCINTALAADAFAQLACRDEQGMSRHLKTLTIREREVLNVLLKGGTSKQVARQLGISPRTVETHRHHLLRKFGVDSFRELMLNRTLLEE
jgi:two-component system response regulator DctR